jgi:hypothetical protein
MKTVFLRLPGLVVCSLASTLLAGCKSDDEKALEYEEHIAAIFASNKDDCDKMGVALSQYVADNGRDMKALRKKAQKQTPEQKKAREEKFAARLKAVEEKTKLGVGCIFTPAVGKPLMELQDTGEDQPGRAPPPRPSTGAPIAFVVEQLHFVDRSYASSLEVSAYNFSDKVLIEYGLMIRYYGADGSVLKLQPGDRDTMHWGISGTAYKIPPKQWRSFRLDHLDMPKGAAKAEILVDSTSALAANGVKAEDTPVFRLASMSWPTK